MEIKFDVYFKKNLGTLCKDNEVDLNGKHAHVNIPLVLVDRLEVNYLINGNKKYTDDVLITDITENLIQIPFKSDVVKKGLNEFEIVAYMKNGDVKTSQTYTYNIDEGIGEGKQTGSGESSDGHTHNNLNILNSITQSKVNEWNDKADATHSHNEYASKSHTHNASEIEGLENVDIDLSDYYTKSETYNKTEIDSKIANMGAGGSVDLSNYYTKSETDEAMNDKANKVHTHNEYLTELPTHEHEQYLTEHQDISHKADKSDIYTKLETDNKISEEIAKAQLGGSGGTNPSIYVTKDYVDNEIDKLKENKLDFMQFDGKIPSTTKQFELENKTWNALGDSITAGITSQTEYVSLISANNNMSTSKNYGIGGTLISEADNNSFVVRYANMVDDVDLVTVMGGTNDALSNVEIGEETSKDIKTFYGALNCLMEGLKNKYPNSRIVFITPLKAKSTNTTLNNKLPNYVNAIIRASINNNIECIDMNTELELLDSDFADGLHPNDSGQLKMADYITSKLNQPTSNIIFISKNNEKRYPVSHALCTYLNDGTLLQDCINQILSRLSQLENNNNGSEVVEVTSVTLNKTSYSMNVDDTITLIPTILPSEATVKTLTWSSTDNDVVSVSMNGTVTARKVGNATIICTSNNNKTAMCTIDVLSNEVEGDVVTEPGLVMYLKHNNRGSNNNLWKDLSGNNNDAELINFKHNSVSGWTDTGLLLDGVDNYINTPVKLFDTIKDFKVELKLSKLKFVEYKEQIVMDCYSKVNYIDGLYVAHENKAGQLLRLKCSGVVVEADASLTGNDENITIEITRSGNLITFKINEVVYKTGNASTKTVDQNLVLGSNFNGGGFTNMEIESLKVYIY